MEGEDADALSSTDSLGVFSTISAIGAGIRGFYGIRAAPGSNHLFSLGNRLGSPVLDAPRPAAARRTTRFARKRRAPSNGQRATGGA